MSLFDIFTVAGSGVSAQSQRLNVVASNLANAESGTGPDGTAYRARQVVFQSVPMDGSGQATGVRVSDVVEDSSPMRKIHDPGNPLADSTGYVTLPNVNVVEEMVNMIAASRSYQTNIDVMSTAKTMLQKVLTLGS